MPPAPASPGQLTPHNKRTVVVTITATLVVLALVSGLGMFFLYRHLDGNLGKGDDISHLVKPAADDEPHRPMNILLLGTDSRDCAGCAIDKEGGLGGSDTTILLHIAADHRSAYGVSIPRDALVKRPDCTGKDGKTVAAADDSPWNRAYAIGGAACTARQVEQLTGLSVDHYISLNFGGFKDMVNAIGGVEVCIPEAVDDAKHHIHLPAGTHVLRDQQALNYVRERYSTPNSDLGRMKRQQYFISSMINKVSSAGILTRPDRLARFANALTKSITTDLDHVSDLVSLASSLRNADLTHIQFVTVPNAAYPQGDPNWGRLRILPSAKRLWTRMGKDRPLGRRLGSGAISAGRSPSGAPSSSPSGAPSSSPSGAPSSTPSDSASASPSSSGSPSTVTSTPADPESAEQAAENGLCA